ncbi:PF07598 domain protein [Leptospira weilii serovar Ranarum str. ICFT]|uniref:PF07598 domain protein n=1 Tax=Leptospira weilii serovar Ranarum str. ICFT TaxID=1218598 RepID=N1WFH9_9LEPT|nr:PF07598 domain protein [Leptospira weilii serovar Ranarum str. ICFT]
MLITDYKGNALRVTRYGSNWGVAYAAKPSFLKNDTTNSPTSLFTVNKDLLNWVRYTTGNLGKTEQYCPAGNQENGIYKRSKRTLPPDFQLSEAWIRRLYDIARSTSGYSDMIRGICGVCLLHSFQMLAEIQEYHSQGPLQSGGYFFDTALNTDPFISFGQRYPLLDTALVDITRVYGPVVTSSRNLVIISAITMLPQYEWSFTGGSSTSSELQSHVTSLINSPPGSVWLAIMRRRRPDGTTGKHAVPILRTSQGLVVIQVAMTVLTYDSYRQALTPTTNPLQVIRNLEGRPDRTMTELSTIRLGQIYHNTFDSMISNGNCTGEGGDRRGTGEYPTSASVNQCPSGRCALPLPF